MKRRNFTFSLTLENTPNIQDVILVVEKYPKYAYILHDKDTHADGSKVGAHYHFYVEFPNPRSLESVAKELQIQSNFIEKVYNKKSILDYLTHKNTPEKHQYRESDIKTNMNLKFETLGEIDPIQFYKDYRLVRCYRINQWHYTPENFLEQYKEYLQKVSIYSLLRIYDMIDRGT